MVEHTQGQSVSWQSHLVSSHCQTEVWVIGPGRIAAARLSALLGIVLIGMGRILGISLDCEMRRPWIVVLDDPHREE